MDKLMVLGIAWQGPELKVMRTCLDKVMVLDLALQSIELVYAMVLDLALQATAILEMGAR